MNASATRWRQWSRQLRACLPEIPGQRSKTLALWVLGLVLAGTTRLPRVAQALGGSSAAKLPRSERRRARLLATPQVVGLPRWTRRLEQVLACWRERRLGCVRDATALDERATVVYLGRVVQAR